MGERPGAGDESISTICWGCVHLNSESALGVNDDDANLLVGVNGISKLRVRHADLWVWGRRVDTSDLFVVSGRFRD